MTLQSCAVQWMYFIVFIRVWMKAPILILLMTVLVLLLSPKQISNWHDEGPSCPTTYKEIHQICALRRIHWSDAFQQSWFLHLLAVIVHWDAQLQPTLARWQRSQFPAPFFFFLQSSQTHADAMLEASKRCRNNSSVILVTAAEQRVSSDTFSHPHLSAQP